MANYLDQITWNDQGLVPVITQDVNTNKVLMFAWMNRQALTLTLEEKRAIYWSRSRNRLWYKGEESGNIQYVKELRIDCDHDVLLLKVEQIGAGACHTGRETCFYQQWQTGEWIIVEERSVKP